jgi:hypothetical protein
MKTLEFEARISADRTLTVPPELAAQIQEEQPVRVILLVPDSAEDREWARLTAEQFLDGYAAGDAIYDDRSRRDRPHPSGATTPIVSRMLA